MADPVRSTNIVADRYLASPAGLRAAGCGPVDALDTHSGRASQVRLVFVSGAWAEADLAETVARWCAIGCSEVCGVLDFGRHGDHWYLALPPSLGVPVARWRTMRLPGPGDAARLTLGFGRLVDRVAAAGFAPELAAVEDFAVGPGPTPFLERPLLPLPSAPLAVTPGSGQRLLAELLGTLQGEHITPAALAEWSAAAAGGEFPTLAACLDALEHAGAEAAVHPDGDPPGLARMFDDDELDVMEAVANRSPGAVRRAVTAAGLAVLGIAAGLALVGPVAGHDRAAQAARLPRTVPVAPASTQASRRPHHAGSAPHHRSRGDRRRGRHVQHPAAQSRPANHRRSAPAPAPTTASSPVTTTAPSPVTTGPAPPPSTAPAAPVMPAPGGTTLPAP